MKHLLAPEKYGGIRGSSSLSCALFILVIYVGFFKCTNYIIDKRFILLNLPFYQKNKTK